MKNELLVTLLLLNTLLAFGQKTDTFDVYFERDDPNVQAKGIEIINKLIADSAIIRGQKLTLLGYADYLGSNGHNDSLSLARARNVQEHLLRMGFVKKDITLCQGKGKVDRKPVGKDGYSSDRKVQIITAKHKNEGLKIEMVKVIGDTFRFAIGKYDITEAQWAAVMGPNPSHAVHCDSCPVVYVSWIDVNEFLQKLNAMTGKHYRLPSEAEWEYAAKGGTKTHNYLFAGDNDLNAVGWFNGNSSNRVHSVGQKKPNELGIYDMSGNVWRWCRNVVDSPKCDRALRGGAYFIKPFYSRVNYHNPQFCSPDERTFAIGFRVAYSL